MQRLTQNTKCLQIALFLMDFVFATTAPVDVDARSKLYFSMFSGCCSCRKFIELCHGLLVLFDGPTPDEAKVLHPSDHVLAVDSTIPLLDYVLGQVSFGKASTLALTSKINQDIDSKFPMSSLKGYANRNKLEQLAIVRYVVLWMFLTFKGNELDTSKNGSVQTEFAQGFDQSLRAFSSRRSSSICQTNCGIHRWSSSEAAKN